jgi:anti-sigma B factor antagonist
VNPAPFEATAAKLDDGLRIIAVRGELDLSTAADLEPPLEEAIASGDASVLIDLSACEFIDSTGIALIVRAWQKLDDRFSICGIGDQVKRVLDVTGLKATIPIHSSRDDALAQLQG